MNETYRRVGMSELWSALRSIGLGLPQPRSTDARPYAQVIRVAPGGKHQPGQDHG